MFANNLIDGVFHFLSIDICVTPQHKQVIWFHKIEELNRKNWKRKKQAFYFMHILCP